MHLSIKTIVLLVSFFFVTISCFIGGLGLYTTKHAVDVLEKAAMRDLSSQSRLNDLKLRMEVNRSQILQALQHTPGTAFAKMHDHPPAVHLEALRSGGVSLSAAWEEFRQTLGNGAGSHLAAVWYERSNGVGIKVVAVSADAIQAAQWDEAARILINEINPLYTQSEPAFQELSALLKMQSEASLVSAHTEVDRNNTLILAAIVCGALLSFGAGLLLVKSIGKPMSEAVAVARRVAEGDLTVSIATNSTNEFGMLLAALSNMQRSLSSVVGRVRVGTDTVAAASKQIASGNLDLSVRTEEQASALEATTGSIEKLSAAVAQNAANAQQANDMAISACAVAERGGAAVAEVTATMRSINDSAGKIVDIIGVIDGIAFQTNILALNAAVEAARAGEQGRGFAVVATEVRNLAQRSAAAAKEIKLLINDSVSKVDSGSRLVDLAGTTMGEIRISIDQVTVIMGEIAAASLEQQLGIEKVSLAITRMDASTLQNAALVEEAAAAAQSLEEQAGILAGVVRTFKIETPNPGSEKDNAGSASYQRRLPAPKSIGDERQS